VEELDQELTTVCMENLDGLSMALLIDLREGFIGDLVFPLDLLEEGLVTACSADATTTVIARNKLVLDG
jgi:hypothetical protein